VSATSTAATFTVLAAPDKFRGTATARELCDAIGERLDGVGVILDAQPMSDGGEGFLDAFSGDDVVTEVLGPLGEPVEARIRRHQRAHGTLGVVEVADVVGRARLVRPDSGEALRASSTGVGQLLLAAQRLGVDEVLIGCGGTANSDGGLGCYEVLRDAGGLSLPVSVATDVTARFSGARRYAAQKGVAPDDLALVDRRLADARDRFLREQGIDVEALDRTGAAGGIPGALAAFGATLTSGFGAVAGSVGLKARVGASSLVVTGEGRLDPGSLEGKVVAGVAGLAEGTPLLVVCGSIDADAGERFRQRFPTAELVSLVSRFGREASWSNAVDRAADAVREHVLRLSAR
jgi:glycerate 2-kinase